MSKSKSGSASKSDSSSVKSFTGTSTGSTYNVGEKYATSRGVVEAQADGTFRNVSTGQISKGSSEAVAQASSFKGSDDGGSDGVVSEGYSGGKQTVKVAFSGTGPGAPAAQSGNATGDAQKGSGAPMVASTGGFFSGIASDLETQALVWGGQLLNTRIDISDGGDWEQRWGEWGGSLAGLAVMAADTSNMLNGAVSENLTELEAGGESVRQRVQQPDGKPNNMRDDVWLQTKLNQYAAEQALVRAHDPENDGLSSLLGNPMKPGSFVDFGSWWK